MKNTISSEWLKLRTVNLNVVLVAIAAGFVLIVTLLVALLNSGPEEFDGGDLAGLVGGTSVVSGFVLSVVAALSITSEFAHDTIRPTLAATPDRTRLFVAKAIVLSIVGFVVGLAVAVGSFLIGLVVLNSRGASVGISGDDGSLAVLIGIPIFFTILTMFGYGLGLLIRSTPAAVAIAILWPLLVETILRGVLSVAGVDEPDHFLPYQSGFALVAPEDSFEGWGRVGGGVFFAVTVGVLVTLAVVVNTRRDV